MKWDILNNSKFKIQSFDTAQDKINSKFEEVLYTLLKNRGITDKKEIEAFLHPDLLTITPKNVGIDAKQLNKTIRRIQKAIIEKEQIIVYGDYDVDGITGGAILWEVLTECGAKVMPYLPHRVDEGYGLSKIGITNLQELYPDLKLIITVDNGIVANEAVDFANSQGIDVIITDHHTAPEEKEKIPKALSIVHTTLLCGAGVAYLLAKELLLHFKKIAENDLLERFLELATLGTIADLVPLIGPNRTIVYHGLKILGKSKRVGMQALFEEAGCDISSVSVYHIGFMIAPRLNAAGRLESAMDSLRLLCTKDLKRATDLAASLGRVNKERQQIMFDSSLHAITHVRQNNLQDKKILFVAHESYNEGVIGLIAGKLVETFYRPAIVVAIGKEKSKGSVRSISGFNIIEYLRLHTDHFMNVGGHPMAAGFSVKTDQITVLQAALQKHIDEYISDDVLERLLKVDMKLELSDVTPELYQAIQTLAPFGMKNPEPTFLSEKVQIEDIRIIGKEGKHLKLKVSAQNGNVSTHNPGLITHNQLEAICFGMGEKMSKLHEGDTVDIVYTIDENTWQGNTKLQLKLKDLQ